MQRLPHTHTLTHWCADQVGVWPRGDARVARALQSVSVCFLGRSRKSGRGLRNSSGLAAPCRAGTSFALMLGFLGWAPGGPCQCRLEAVPRPCQCLAEAAPRPCRGRAALRLPAGGTAAASAGIATLETARSVGRLCRLCHCTVGVLICYIVVRVTRPLTLTGRKMMRCAVRAGRG